MSKTIKIAFAGGGIIPAAVMGTKKDVTVPPHEPVRVPDVYGRHLIKDRLAYDPAEKEAQDNAVAEARAGRVKASSADHDAAEQIEDLKGKLAAAAKLAGELQSDIEIERRKVSDLESKLAAAEEQVSALQGDLDKERAKVSDLESKLAAASKPADDRKGEDGQLFGEDDKSKSKA